jgi:iron-sulfur cluster repair protein YtfE (RIC family)
VADGFELLRTQHRHVAELFDRYNGSSDEAVAREIWTELTLHTEAEERALYPQLRRLVDGGDDMADIADGEHAAIKALIARAYDSPPADLRPLMQSLREDVQRHVAREEREVFPAMEEAGVDPAQLADRLHAAEGELESRGTKPD